MNEKTVMDKQVKVIKIVDDHKIVINGGTVDGFHVGDELEVFLPGGPVIDPETGESLGTLDPIKAYIEIRNIYPKMALCVNREREPLTSLMSVLADMNQTLRSTVPKRLPVNPEDISGGWLEDQDKQISVGDLVRKSRS